jgi:hypothetical protein
LAAFDNSGESFSHRYGSPEETSAVTDRFVPARKSIKRDSMFKEEGSEMEDENENVPEEGEGTRLIDLYKRYVMELSPQNK